MRDLSHAQSARLEKLDAEEVGTVVCAWSDEHSGPVIRRTRNGERRDDRAAFRVVDFDGHLKPLRREVREQLGL